MEPSNRDQQQHNVEQHQHNVEQHEDNVQQAGSGDRRKVDERNAVSVAETKKVRKVNYWLIFAVICMASVLLTMVTVLWDINERAKERETASAFRERNNAINEYLSCVQLFASGVDETSCEKYRDWIMRNTNVRDVR